MEDFFTVTYFTLFFGVVCLPTGMEPCDNKSGKHLTLIEESTKVETFSSLIFFFCCHIRGTNSSFLRILLWL